MLLLLPLRRAFAIFRTVFARSLGSRHARLFETAPDTIASTSSPGAQVCAFVNLGSLQLREAAAPESSEDRNPSWESISRETRSRKTIEGLCRPQLLEVISKGLSASSACVCARRDVVAAKAMPVVACWFLFKRMWYFLARNSFSAVFAPADY